ncbi:MAG TPA: hypothetical protein VF230_10630 [Acidimicrobiales bacterium]
MLFRRHDWPGVEDGSITVAFRRWKRPTVKTGGRLRSPGGLLAIDDVRVLGGIGDVDERDLPRTGLPSLDALVAFLGDGSDRPGTQLYRVEFHRIGDDDRVELRARVPDDAAAVSELDARLARFDRASARGPWTRAVLELIRERPGVRAGDLAETLGRERLPFKADVRKLKALGLTESLEVGYRLSPRGAAYLDATATDSSG